MLNRDELEPPKEVEPHELDPPAAAAADVPALPVARCPTSEVAEGFFSQFKWMWMHLCSMKRTIPMRCSWTGEWRMTRPCMQ